eukprot:gene7264-376_t
MQSIQQDRATAQCDRRASCLHANAEDERDATHSREQSNSAINATLQAAESASIIHYVYPFAGCHKPFELPAWATAHGAEAPGHQAPSL